MSENSNNNHLQRLLEDINHFNTYNDYFFPTPLYNHYDTQEPIQRVLTESLYDKNPIKYVITEEVKNGLVPIKFKHVIDKENNEKCSITVEPFKDEDEIIQLPCNHCFFVEPIMKWLTEDSCECPVCRYKFDSMEKNTREETEQEQENNEEEPEEENNDDIEHISAEENEEFYNDFAYESMEQLHFGNFLNFINMHQNNFISPYPLNIHVVEDSSYNDLD
jgi:hypothetical protein